MNIVECIDIKKTYRQGKVEVKALNGVNLSIKKGAFVALAGPSGSGKTTMLNLMAGLMPPDTGKADIRGRFSYVFQDARLLPWETVRENTMYAMDPHLHKRERLERVDTLLDLLELKDAAHLLPGQISGGMARRTALARALLAPHEAILLDEPLSSLDPDMKTRIVELLPERLEGKAVVLVTHDYVTAAALSNRVFRLSLPPVVIRPVDINDLEGTLDQIERIDRGRSIPDGSTPDGTIPGGSTPD